MLDWFTGLVRLAFVAPSFYVGFAESGIPEYTRASMLSQRLLPFRVRGLSECRAALFDLRLSGSHRSRLADHIALPN
jgi:hypothetical protein